MKQAISVGGMILALAFVSGQPLARELTFDERVAAQTAIESLYHSHRAGTTRSFEQAVPAALVEDKVRTYLRQSRALETYWSVPVTAAALDRELERIAGSTVFADRLEQLYDALGRANSSNSQRWVSRT